jgi:Fur family transcriptional regulator, peroxide stress response regulator
MGPNKLREYILHSLKEKGIRLTPQRMEIVSVLTAEKNHPSPSMILRKAKKRIPLMSSSTVYYTLALLKKEGLVKELEFYDMENRYDTVVKDHVDLICEECGAIENLNEEIPYDRRMIEESTGFEAHRMRFEYYGRCKECRSK